MKKIVISMICGIAFAGSAMSQFAEDALLMSQYYAGGTARSAGMSGAFGALGGDLSTLSFNPAGLGVYRGSEFTFTPAVSFANTKSMYDGRSYKENSSRLVINNIGYVYTWNFFNEKGIKSINFGVAYNRLSDFNSEAHIYRPNATSSMLDGFVWNANYDYQENPIEPTPIAPDQLDPFYEGLAYDTDAVYIGEDGLYYSDYDKYGYDQQLKRDMWTRGGIGEYSLSMGANLNHVLFFGAALGIQDVYYETGYFHEETPGFIDFQYFNFSDKYTLSGWGLNFKMGVIYRPIQMLRIGAAVHTPTRLWVRPYWLTEMDTYFSSNGIGGFADTETDPSVKRSKITTPWRYNASAAVVLGKFGLVNVDVEYTDYSTCELWVPQSNDYQTDNAYASVAFKGAVNVRSGAELRLGPVYLRGGVACYGSPYEKDYLSVDDKGYQATMSYSGGIGFRARGFYMDVAYSYMKFPQRENCLYTFYDDLGLLDEWAQLKTNSNKIALTFGFRF